MKATNISKTLGLGAFISIFGFIHSVEAQDFSSLGDCAVINVNSRYNPNSTGGTNPSSYVWVPGVGSFFDNKIHSQPMPPGHRSVTGFTCLKKNTLPITNEQLLPALNSHLEKINTSIEANTIEVQQTVAQSFAIQIDVLASEIAEIRSLLSGVDEQDAAVIGARLDSLEARLDALTQIANN